MRSADQIESALKEKDDGLIGLVVAFLVLRDAFSPEELDRFLDVVPEKGEALWLRFKAWQREHPDTPPDLGFVEFIRETIADPQPEPSPTPIPA